MSTVAWVCPAKATTSTYLKWWDECNRTDVLLSIDELPNRPDSFSCELVATCPIIEELKVKDAYLQSEINNLNDQTNELRNKDDEIVNSITNINNLITSITNQITEINQNITILKWWNIRQDQKIKSLTTTVIKDTTHLSFEEWVQEVYIPRCGSGDNIYSEWDIYINANQSVSATNSTYVNIRPADANYPCGASDWQQTYSAPPSDLLSIIGIDPISVSHPFQNQWVISIEPNKLADIISKLDTLNLCDVDVRLGTVYWCWADGKTTTFHDNVKIAWDLEVNWQGKFTESISVDNTANIGDLIVERVTNLNWPVNIGDDPSDDVCIKGTIVCPLKIDWETHFGSDVVVDGTLTVVNFVTEERGNTHVQWDYTVDGNFCVNGKVICDTLFEWKVTINNDLEVTGCIKSPCADIDNLTSNNTNLTGDTYIGGDVHGDITFTDNVTINNSLKVTNNIQGDRIHIIHDAKFDEEVVLGWAVNWNDPYDTSAPSVCVDNIFRNLFMPSYGIFRMTGSVSNSFNTAEWLFGIGSDAITAFNDQQWAAKVVYAGYGTTQLIHDTAHASPGVTSEPLSGGTIIKINDPGIYNITFHMTWEITGNVYAHRAGVVLYTADGSGSVNSFIIDDKHATARDSWTMTHSHRYYDSDSWGSSTYRTTDSSSISSYDRCEPNGSTWSNVVARSDDHYTYSVSALIPVSKSMIVAPFFKPTSWCASKTMTVGMTITDGVWQTWSGAWISIHKVANIYAPYEYNC